MHAPERISHFNVLSTLLDMYGLAHVGPNAQPIDVWRVHPKDLHRTVVFVSGVTTPGQDMFLRGGIDYGYASAHLGFDCNADPGACQIPIHHRNMLDATTAPLKANDDFLDWIGPEPNQDPGGTGTPADYTIDQWPPAWGPIKTVAADGYGVEPLNTWGPYWMLDVDMDCAKTVGGWFEVKSFITNGPGWEPDVAQTGTPYASTNHMGQCGMVNRFDRGASTADIHPI
jgi:alpha-amylase